MTNKRKYNLTTSVIFAVVFLGIEILNVAVGRSSQSSLNSESIAFNLLFNTLLSLFVLWISRGVGLRYILYMGLATVLLSVGLRYIVVFIMTGQILRADNELLSAGINGALYLFGAAITAMIVTNRVTKNYLGLTPHAE